MPENRNPSQMVKALIAVSVVKTQQCEPSQNEPSWPPSRWQCVCDIMCKWALNLNQVPRAVWRLLAAVLTTNMHRGIEAVKWSETMAVTSPGCSSCAVNIQITPTLLSPGPRALQGLFPEGWGTQRIWLASLNQQKLFHANQITGTCFATGFWALF